MGGVHPLKNGRISFSTKREFSIWTVGCYFLTSLYVIVPYFTVRPTQCSPPPPLFFFPLRAALLRAAPCSACARLRQCRALHHCGRRFFASGAAGCLLLRRQHVATGGCIQVTWGVGRRSVVMWCGVVCWNALLTCGARCGVLECDVDVWRDASFGSGLVASPSFAFPCLLPRLPLMTSPCPSISPPPLSAPPPRPLSPGSEGIFSKTLPRCSPRWRQRSAPRSAASVAPPPHRTGERPAAAPPPPLQTPLATPVVPACAWSPSWSHCGPC